MGIYHFLRKRGGNYKLVIDIFFFFAKFQQVQDRLDKKSISLLVSMRAIPPIITNDLIILFNRDNFLYVHTSIDLTN